MREAMPGEILLGFEVPTGDPIYIRAAHLAIFGMTQLSGKTTTLEALISRSSEKAVAFITKRGEAGFRSYNRIPLYYRAEINWRYIEGLLNTALGEKVKYEPRMRWAIMQVSRGPRTLHEVHDLCVKKLREATKSWDKEVYEKLIEYLDIVLPEMDRLTFSNKVELKNGVNVMDLAGLKLETQQLIIGSTIKYIYENLENVVVIIPEAWEMLPQSRMTPVKLIAEQFIRKGASVNNFMWIDSQDIGGIDKTPLRQVSTWIMGRMMEAHEVERIGKQLLGVKIPAQEIQTLPLGQFYVTVGDQIKKVYILPTGVPEHIGEAVSHGTMTPEQVRDAYLKPSRVLEDESKILSLLQNLEIRVVRLEEGLNG